MRKTVNGNVLKADNPILCNIVIDLLPVEKPISFPLMKSNIAQLEGFTLSFFFLIASEAK